MNEHIVTSVTNIVQNATSLNVLEQWEGFVDSHAYLLPLQKAALYEAIKDRRAQLLNNTPVFKQFGEQICLMEGEAPRLFTSKFSALVHQAFFNCCGYDVEYVSHGSFYKIVKREKAPVENYELVNE